MSRTRSARIRLCAVLVSVVLGVSLTACSSSSKPTANTTTSGLVGTSVPPGYVATKPVPPEALAAITKYLTAHGPPIGSWVITSMQASTVDPSFVLYRISPAAGHESEGASGYGFAQEQGTDGFGSAHSTKWTALGFGTDAVGCSPGAPDDPVIPPPVLVSFSLTCAPAP